MTERIPSDEWKESSNWDDIVGWNGGYTLGVGYCYTKQFNGFFKKHQHKYHFFETKWGRCGTTFLFSALRPDSILIPVAWGNAAAVCQSTEILFRIWRDILKNLLSLEVKTMMIDFPSAWHISSLAKDMNGIDNAQLSITERRKEYYDYVIKPYESMINFQYIDLYDLIPYNSSFIYENIQEPKVITAPSPWHIKQELIDIIGGNFLQFINNDYSEDKLKEDIKIEP